MSHSDGDRDPGIIYAPPASVGRRRALLLLAATSGLGLSGLAHARTGAGAHDKAAFWGWRGTALGAPAQMALYHRDLTRAQKLVDRALAEIERLERIFSLYRGDSALVSLNRNGYLDDPPLELVDLLSRAQAWSRETGGAFDVTVQPLWVLYRDHFLRTGGLGKGPGQRDIAAARKLADWRKLEIRPHRVRLGRPGMAVTLNGIAQGYITDRIADMFHAEGLDQVLISLGEMRGIGGRGGDVPWRIGLGAPEESGKIMETVELVDKAVATSAVSGLQFDRNRRFHHLLDPRIGRPSAGLVSVTVVADRACDADALSTALIIGGWRCLPQSMASRLGVTRIVTVDATRRVRQLRFG